ncbi:MAG: hypothetical protein QM535_02340 [Limnohabitans sp.]|nr:hypothetical protein [Limnohabitans sp.]
MERFKITIPKPCHENWDEMTPEDKGRFCSVCSKTVVDFTEMNNEQVNGFFAENKDKKVCGRFKNEQVEKKFTFNVPYSLLCQKRTFHKAFLLTLFVVMGTTLFSCKNFNGQQMGEVAVQEDSIALTAEQDSISKNSFMLGKPAVKSDEVLLPPPPSKVSDIKSEGKKESGTISMGMPIAEPTIVIKDSSKVK